MSKYMPGKPFLLVACFIVFGLAEHSAQQGIQWDEPVDVSVTSGNKGPVVGVLNDGNPVLIWGNGSTILFSKMTDGAFTTPVAVPTGSVSPNIYSFGGIDMAVQDSQIFIVFENFDDGVFIVKSTDEGNSFEAPVNVYDPEPGKWTTLASVAIDEQGNPLVSVILENIDETQGRYIMMRSQDGGASFTAPVVASEPADGEYVCECCPSDIHTAGQDVWLVFRNNDNNLRDMWVARSDDSGASFNQAVDVDATDWVLSACPISGPKMAPMGGDSLMTVWKSGGSGAVRVSISTLNGATMEKGYERFLPTTGMNAIQSGPDIAGANDTIGIVWEETGFGVNSIDLMFALSTNGSLDLVSNISNITEAPGVQKFPSLVFADGVFHVFHTNGNGLQYRRGLVTSAAATTEPGKNARCLKLMENPSADRTIRLKNTCPSERLKINITLSDATGNIVGAWYQIDLDSGSEFAGRVPHVPTGVYFLSILSEGGMWSQQVLIE